jgi:hypothetical protein
MTDAYPPFRLDMGGEEPESATGAAQVIQPEPATGMS